MSDNRKYYYLKLKENYFDDDSIVLLESMQDGVLYSNILLKLYLKSLKHGGRLQLDEDIPYTAQMIATITRQQIGTVERALQIFLKLGLVEVLDSGTFYMSNIELLIGQSSRISRRSLRQVFGRCCYGCFVYDGQRSCTGSSRPAGIGRNQAALGAIYQPAARLCVSLQRPAERKNVIYQTRCQEPYSASGTFFVDFL